jgi:hypothetical protein
MFKSRFSSMSSRKLRKLRPRGHHAHMIPACRLLMNLVFGCNEHGSGAYPWL